MKWNDEDVIAYIDGELAPKRRAEIEADLALDAQLSDRIERQRIVANRVHAKYAAIQNEPVPARFVDLLATGEPKSGDDSWLTWLKSLFIHPVASPGVAAMASLALGLFIGGQFLGSETGISGESTLANARLASALNAPSGTAEWQMPVTFRDDEGRYCRAFRGTEAITGGLACREQGGWQVQLLMSGGSAADSDYQLAGSSMPPALLEAIDGLIDGDPLDRNSIENAATAGWME